MRNRPFAWRRGMLPTLALVLVVVGAVPPIQAAQMAGGGDMPSSAQPLTLEQAQTLALRNNPTLQAAQAAIRIPEAQWAQAYRFSNPILSVGVLPGLNAGTGLNVSLAKRFEIAGQRGLRAGTLLAQVEATRWEAANVARALRVKVALAFYGVRVGQELVQRVDSVVAATARLVEAAHLKYQAGLAPELDENMARIQLLQARVQRARISRELAVRAAELNALTGRSADTAVQAAGPLIHRRVPDALSARPLEAYARRTRPDAQALVLAGQAAVTSIDLARRLAVPDLVLGLGLNKDADGIRTVGLSAGFSLPVFDRNQVGLDRARAERSLISARTDATDLAISREVRSASAGLEAARTELLTYQDEVLAIAEANQSFAAAAYARGELDITSAVLVQQQFADTQVGYLIAVLAFDEAAVELEGAVGAPLTDFAMDPTDPEEEGGR